MEPSQSRPAYRVQTQRMVIRCWNPADAVLLKEAVDSSIDHLLPWMPWAKNEPQELLVKINLLRTFRGKFDLGQDFIYGIFNLDESQVLGGTGLHTRLGDDALEIGYWIRADSVNLGLATEAAAALTRVAFEVNRVNRVEIHCDPENKASAAVPGKLGYRHEATLRQRILAADGTYRDMMIWTMLKDEYTDSIVASYRIEAFDAVGVKIL
jgi:RimJ/RimL family protein N-acetyltransferase